MAERREREEPQRLDDFILRRVDEGFCVPLDPDDLARRLNASSMIVSATLARLVGSGILIRLVRQFPVREVRYLRSASVERAKSILARELAVKKRMSTSDLKTVLGQSRRTAIPLLEYLDSIGFTRREGECRLLVRAGLCKGPTYCHRNMRSQLHRSA